MSTSQPKDETKKFSATLQVIVAIIAIIGFIFGATQWSDIQQYFWRQRVAGTWQDESGVSYMFDTKGNFSTGGVIPINGGYTFINRKQLLLQYSGLLGVLGSQVFEVSFSQGRVYLIDQHGFETVLTRIR